MAQLRRPKVLIWEALDFLGGGQKLALEIGEALKGDFAVEFLVPGPGKLTEALSARQVPYRFLFQNRFSRGKKSLVDILRLAMFAPRVFWGAMRTISRSKPALIYANAAPTFLYAAVIGKLLGIPVVWHVHNYFADAKTVWLLNHFAALDSVRLIICESKALEVQFRPRKYKVISICPGIDVEGFRRFDRSEDARGALGIDRAKRIVLQIGWVMPAKGQHVLVEAARDVLAQRSDVVFLLIGQNLPGHESYLAELRDRIARYRLEGTVHILGFWDDIQSLFAEAFVNVITSFEGFSLVMLEAAALDLPTLGPDVGGPGVVIEDGHSGMIYKFEDPKDLARGLLELLQDEPRYRRLRQNCAGFVAKYTVNRYRAEIRNTVTSLFPKSG